MLQTFKYFFILICYNCSSMHLQISCPLLQIWKRPLVCTIYFMSVCFRRHSTEHILSKSLWQLFQNDVFLTLAYYVQQNIHNVHVYPLFRDLLLIPLTWEADSSDTSLSRQRRCFPGTYSLQLIMYNRILQLYSDFCELSNLSSLGHITTYLPYSYYVSSHHLLPVCASTVWPCY